MNRSSIFAKVTPLLLGVGLCLSACAATPDFGAPSYSYSYPYVGSGYPYDTAYNWLDFGFGGSDPFHYGWDSHHGHDDHVFAQHAGHSFAPSGVRGVTANFGHGFAGHGGFGGHGGHGRA
jgi:hypothetical protein